jgi:hypothetical protein
MKAIEKKVGESKFVFIGTVKKIGASNVAALEASKQLALVQINQVALAPEAFVGTVGTTVTVKIPPRIKLRSGDTRLFFTKRLMYGENLAVEATAIEQVEKAYDRAVKEVKTAASNIERKEQLARISRAAVIVEGRVTQMQESESNKEYPLSFKSPYWVSVVIQIARVIKGDHKGNTIEAFINKGGESEEATALEIEIGKSGVWLLGKEAIFKDLKNANPFYVIEEPDDFLNSYEYEMLTHPKVS